MSFLSSLFLLFGSISTAHADEYSNLDSDQYGLRVSMEEKSQVRGASKHGFRMGYGYVNAAEDHELLQSNWLYLLGYELNQTIYGGDWINVLFVQNISVVGVNQSLFIPSGNILMGFEFNERFQVASGINMIPSDNWCHRVVAAGWTPKVGDINIPFHVSYVPDVDNQWRTYLTTGVNW